MNRPAQGPSVCGEAQKDEIRSAIERVAHLRTTVPLDSGAVRQGRSAHLLFSVETGESEESVTSEYQGPDLRSASMRSTSSIFFA